MEVFNSTLTTTCTTANGFLSDFDGYKYNQCVSTDHLPLKIEGEVYYWTRIIIVTTVSAFVVIISILNICILTRKCHIPKISWIFLLNLSISDLSVGVNSCLPTIYSAVMEYWPYGGLVSDCGYIPRNVVCDINMEYCYDEH